MCPFKQFRCRRPKRWPSGVQVGVEARIRDPDAVVDADELGNRGPPSILVRLASALMYLVPWIDIIGLGRIMYHKFPATLLLYVIPGAPNAPGCLLFRKLLCRSVGGDALPSTNLKAFSCPALACQSWCHAAELQVL